MSRELLDINNMLEEVKGRSEELGIKRRDVLCSLERCIKAEETYWHQKAKSNWRHEGDEKNLFSSFLVDGEGHKF